MRFYRPLFIFVTLVLISFDAFAGSLTLLENTSFIREKGKPTIETVKFVGQEGKNFQLEVFNGGANHQYCRISSANIWFNGKQVFKPSDFNQQVFRLQQPVTLSDQNTVSVELRSKPGCGIELNVAGEQLESDLSITSVPPTEAITDKVYQYSIETSVAVEWELMTQTLLESPQGMTIQDGVITWTPSEVQVGDYPVSFSLLHPHFGQAEQSYVINVVHQNEPPVASSATHSVDEDSSILITLEASDPDGDSVEYSLVGLPQHGVATLNGSSLTYTPTENFYGSDSLEFVANDGELTSNKATISFQVIGVNDAPVIISTPTLSALEDALYTYLIEAEDVDNNSLNYSLDLSPAGMTLNVVTGQVQWTPSQTELGAHLVRIIVSDQEGLEAIQNFELTVLNVNDAPTITSSPVKNIDENSLYYYQVEALDSDEGDSLTYKLAKGPAGMHIETLTGAVTWDTTSSDIGIHHIEIIALDESGLSDNQVFELKVLDVADAPKFVSSPDTRATQDLIYEYQLIASDADKDDTLIYELVAGPLGMSINRDSGLLTWIPDYTQVGENNASVIVTDTSGLMDTQTFSLYVENINDAPSITSEPVTVAQETQSYFYQILANDKDQDPLSYQLLSAPTGMSIDSTGLIQWIPSVGQAGEHNVQLEVSDKAGASDQQQYKVLVDKAPNTAPTAKNLLVHTQEDSSVSLTLDASDIDDNELTYHIVSEPKLGQLSGAAPNLVYQPNSHVFGQDSFSFKVHDGSEDSNVAVITFNISPVNDLPVAIPQNILTNEDESTRFTLSGSDIDGDELTFSVVQSPVNGQITGTVPELYYAPNTDFNGSDLLTFIVSDGVSASVEETVSITVSSINDAPVITSKPKNDFVIANDEWRYKVEATDIDSELLTFSLLEAPADLILDTSSRELIWQTNDTAVGQHNIIVVVADESGASTQQQITIDVLAKERKVSHVGTEFWLPISINTESESSSRADGTFDINIVATSEDSEVTVEIPALNIVETLQVNANSTSVYSLNIADLRDAGVFNLNTKLINKAIHITSVNPISVYLMSQKASTTDGYLGLPVSGVGKSYIASSYNMMTRLGVSKTVDGGQYGPIISMVASENNTTVTIDPIMDIFSGGQSHHYKGELLTFILNKGDVYHLETKGSYKADLTGTLINSDKPISVVSQFDCVLVPDATPACDHVAEQLPPLESLSNEYVTAPLWGRGETGLNKSIEYGDTFRAVAATDNTQLYINDVLRANLQKGDFYEFRSTEGQRVSANHPFALTQFSNGDQFDRYYRELENDYADPFMVVVPPINQFLESYIITTTSRDLAYNFVNLLVPNNAIPSVMVDDQPLDSSKFISIFGTDYSYIQQPISSGSHKIEADEPIGVYVYGYDYYESYGYLGGMALSQVQNNFDMQMTAEPSLTLDQEWCADIQIFDEYQRPVQGVRVDVRVNGVTEKYGYVFTDSNGESQYCYQAYQTGQDIVSANVGEITEQLQINWQVGTENRAPVITSVPTIQVKEGDNYIYDLVAVDPNEDRLTYTLEASPRYMTVDDNGRINWPSATFNWGTFNREKVIVRVTDIHGDSTTQSFELAKLQTFNTEPEYLPATQDSVAYTGVPYIFNTDKKESSLDYPKYQIPVKDLDEDGVYVDLVNGPETAYIQRITSYYTSIERPNEPRHCQACTHYLRWTPENVGEQQFDLTIRDARGATNEPLSFVVNVLANQPPIVVNFNAPDVASVGSEYSYTLEVDNDVPLYQYGNLDDLRVVFEESPLRMQSEMVRATGTQKLRLRWTPVSNQVGENIVRFHIADRLNKSEAIEFSINVLDDNKAPVISNQNLPSAEVSILYQLSINAYDPEGTALTYELDYGPEGMVINPVSGLITWTPPEQYENEQVWFRVTVTDADGLSSEKAYSLNTNKFYNRAPTFTDAHRPKYAKVGVMFKHQAVAVDREGDNPIRYTIRSNASGVTIDQVGNITWTPQAQGRYWISVNAFDSLNNFSSANSIFWHVDVVPETSSLDAQLSLTPSHIIDLGESVNLVIEPINEASSVTALVDVDSNRVQVSPELTAQLIPERVGTIPISVTVTDGYQSIVRTTKVIVRDPSDITPPEVKFNSPINLDEISEPTDIFATVKDEQLAEVVLLYKPANEPLSDNLLLEDFTELYRGGREFNNEVIAALDTSNLLNGTYHILLQATDANGNSNASIIAVNVVGELKVGHFSISLEDLNLPMSGLPLSVSRTYDSRRKDEQLDFGYGWSIDYQSVRLQESDEPTKGWTQVAGRGAFNVGGYIINTSAVCILPSYGKTVTVTLPDGDTETFSVALRPTSGSPQSLSDPNCYMTSDRNYDVYFTPKGDTQSFLRSTDGLSLYLSQLDNGYLSLVGESSAELVTNYTLTTRNGFVYQLDQNFGVKKITDPNGNTITYSESGIVHSNGTSIAFERDALGRIDKIVLPAGEEILYQYNASGDLVYVTDQAEARSEYRYNASHYLEEIIDPLNRTLVKNIYNDDGRLVAQEDENGIRSNFEHNVEGRESVVTDRLGRTNIYYYDDRGSVTQHVDPFGGITSYVYDEKGNQLSKTDPLGRTTSATYSAENDMLTETDALGNITSYTYDDLGNPETIVDTADNITQTDYDLRGNIQSITDADNNVTRMTYVEGVNGLVRSVIDALQNETSYTYNRFGIKGSETNSLGYTTTYQYDDNANLVEEKRTRTLSTGAEEEIVTTYEYDARNRLIKTVFPDGSSEQTEYDLIGNEVAKIDSLERRTEMDYDTYGRLVETRYPDNSVSTKNYDAEGNVLSEVDRNGNTTSYEYDKLNRVIKTTLSDDSVTHIEYDAVGQVIANIDAKGNRTTYEYDKVGRRTKVIDSLGNEHSFAYDSEGNLISETDALGRTRRYEYDVLGRKTATVFDNSTSVATEYDGMGRQTAKLDQAQVRTEYEYDAMGQLLKVIDAQGNETSYTYDEQGNKLTQTDAEGRVTRWAYDKMGRVLTRTLPMGQVESFTYDELGRQQSHTDFNNDTKTYTYTRNDQVESVTYSDGTVESFTYDANGNRLSATSEQGTVSYQYDTQNRLIKETKVTGDVLEYQYDGNGNKAEFTVTYSDGRTRTETFDYDALNRLQSVTDDNGNITSYGYDKVGNRTSISYPNGASQTYEYDNLNRLIKLSHYNASGALINQFDYTLLSTGHRTQIDELNGRTSHYTHDTLYRLTHELITDPVNGDYTAEYQFDNVGNRIYSTVNGVQTVYTYNNNDWLTQEGGERYTYDDNGNTLTKTIDGFESRYLYNAKNKLIEAELNNAGVITNTSYEYDVNGIRTAKTEGDVLTNFIVDNNQAYAQVIAETNSNDVVAKEYVFGDDLISQSNNSESHYFMYDGLGSTRSLTDSSGNTSDEYFYDAFGVTLAQTGTTDNDYLYTGEQFDSTLDNYYLRARYYDQSIGRFTQMDTWMGHNQDPITLHKYLYANADPVTYTDPTGNFSIAGTMKAVNTVATLASIATATYDIYGYASGEKEVTAKNVGWTAIMILAGGSGKAIKMFQTAKAQKYFKAAVESGSFAKLVLRNGRTSETLLKRFIPSGTKNTFKPSLNIRAGEKYEFKIGKMKFSIKWHSPDLNALVRHPNGNSGRMWTAQIKVGNKFLGSDGRWYRKARDETHIPIGIYNKPTGNYYES